MEPPKRIEVRDKKMLVLTWDDGAVTTISAGVARDACTCAGCRTEPGGPLRIVPPSATIESASLVGAYALNLVFGPDGHSTGIYDWETLHRVGSPLDS